MQLDTARTYRLQRGLHLRTDGDKLLVLDARSYTVHELNRSAAIVAHLCDGSMSCEQMVAEIVTEHASDTHAAAEIVYRGLQLLHEQGLLEST